MRWIRGSFRFIAVTAGIIVLTALGVDATQYFSGSQSALGILATKSIEGGCPDGMTKLDLSEGSICIDTFEVSVGNSCKITQPSTALETKENINSAACLPESKPEALPWTSVTYLQAKELCAKRGMRLPNNHEWFEAALGTPDNTRDCNLNGELDESGVNKACVSSRGVFDMIGNVWEWVDGEVKDGDYNSRQLPEEGYVAETDGQGVALTTTSTPQKLFDDDYFWSESNGVYAMMRGGFYGSNTDGGDSSVHAAVTPSFSGPAIGFRCVQ